MIELILAGFVGGVVTYAGIALRLREPGESVAKTIMRPFGAGGPGPRK